MNDRELLELAAKAAGWTWWRSKHGYWNVTTPDGTTAACCVGWTRFDPFAGEEIPEPTPADALSECNWSPLTDDGDEARLEAELGLDITWSVSRVSAQHRLGLIFVTENFDDHGGDKQKARRYAGTRAAAAIGEAMKP